MRNVGLCIVLVIVVVFGEIYAQAKYDKPFESTSVRSDFGPRLLKSGKIDFHEGVDYGKSEGTPIKSPETLTITNIYMEENEDNIGIKFAELKDNGNEYIQYLHIFHHIPKSTGYFFNRKYDFEIDVCGNFELLKIPSKKK